MENNITDLFADSSVNPVNDSKKKNPKDIYTRSGKKMSNSSLKSSAVMEAMKLMSTPKKLTKILIVLGLLLAIGLFSVVAFFVIYPVCILYAMISYIVIAMAGRIIKYRKNVISKRNP